jgi:hypothetical protein
MISAFVTSIIPAVGTDLQQGPKLRQPSMQINGNRAVGDSSRRGMVIGLCKELDQSLSSASSRRVCSNSRACRRLGGWSL